MESFTSPLRICLLGRLSACRNGHEIARFQSRKTGALLAYLAYHLERSHPRDALIEQFWPSTDLQHGQWSLCSALRSIKRQIEPPGILPGSVLVSSRIDVRLNATVISTDVAEFNSLLSAARDGDANRRMQLLSQADALYRGVLLPGCYEDWVLPAREHLSASFAHCVVQTVALYEAQGNARRALDCAHAGLMRAPDREELWSEVIRLQLVLGDQAAAWENYLRLKRVCEEDSGRLPSATSQAIVACIDGPPQRPVAAAGRNRTSLYAAGVKQRVEAVGEEQPSESSAATKQEEGARVSGKVPALPATLTRFFGREPELAKLADMLTPAVHAPDCTVREGLRAGPLVVLTGPGGSGKTRVALEFAHRVSPLFHGRVVFVSLAEAPPQPASEIEDRSSLEKTQSVLFQTLLTGLGAPPHRKDSPEDQAIDHLARFNGDPVLLILDNAEHLAAACATVIGRLRERVPSIHFLVTSRMPLQGVEAQLFMLGALPVPNHPGTPERLLEYACVRLFVDRAQAVCPDFQLTASNAAHITALCARLEGIPLAIELAAGRASALSPGQMVEQLRHRFAFLTCRRGSRAERHRTLREMLAWSYRLLPSETQQFFSALSIFRGGWTLEAAQMVCCGGHGASLDHMELLVQSSLVVAEPNGTSTRYRMLESVREFAAESLSDEVAAHLRNRHAQYYSDLAGANSVRLRGPESRDAANSLDPEQDNLKQAFETLASSPTGLRMAGSLWRYWLIRGMLAEGHQVLCQTLEGNPDGLPADRANALIGLGMLALQEGLLHDVDRAGQLAEAACRDAGDHGLLGEALTVRAHYADALGDHELALKLGCEAVTRFECVGSLERRAAALNNLGHFHRNAGDYTRARECLLASQAAFREIGDPIRAAQVLNNLGVAALEAADYASARSACEQSLQLFRWGGSPWLISVALYNLAEALYRECRHSDARSLVVESIRIRRELGERAGMPLALSTLGNILGHEGCPVRGVRLLSAAAHLHDDLGQPLPGAGKQLFEQDVQALKVQLAVEDFRAAWSFGQSLTFEEAVSFALEAAGTDKPPENAMAVVKARF